MTRKSEHYQGKVRWTCGSLSRGPRSQEQQARASNVLRMRFQRLRCSSAHLRGLAVVRSTLPWNFCLRRGPYAFVWSEACFKHFGATELHNQAAERPESLNTTMGRCERNTWCTYGKSLSHVFMIETCKASPRKITGTCFTKCQLRSTND